MPQYAPNKLKQYKHQTPKTPQYIPYPAPLKFTIDQNPPAIDNIPSHPPKCKKYIQQIVFFFLKLWKSN